MTKLSLINNVYKWFPRNLKLSLTILGSPYNGVHQTGVDGRGSSLGMAGAAGGIGIGGHRTTPTIRVEPYGELPDCFHISHELQSRYPIEIRRAIHNVQFIHHHMVQQDKFDEVRLFNILNILIVFDMVLWTDVNFEGVWCCLV